MARNVAYGHEITVDGGATASATSAASAANTAATRADDAADRVEASEDDARNFSEATSSFVSIVDAQTYEKGAKGWAADAQNSADYIETLLDDLSIPTPFGINKAVSTGYELTSTDDGKTIAASGSVTIPDTDLEWTKPTFIVFVGTPSLLTANANVTVNGVTNPTFTNFTTGDTVLLIPLSTAKTYRLALLPLVYPDA